jgi:endo-1,4-beta-xylanase
MDLAVYVTELDVNTRGVEGGPDAQDQAVAKVYRDYLGLVLPEPNVDAVLTWGITDAHTWLNSRAEWAQRKDGTRQRPLPFDDQLQPTPAFESLRSAIDASRPAVHASVPALPGDIAPEKLYKPFRAPASPAS